MIDKTPEEQKALEAVLPVLIDLLQEIGFEKLIADYTRDDALTLIEGIVSSYQDALAVSAPHLLPKKGVIYACYG